MKKVYLLVFACFIIAGYRISAQCIACYNYQFTHFTSTYTNVTDAPLFDSSDVYFGGAAPIGFRFYHYGEPYDSISVDGNGFANLFSSLHDYESDFYPFLAFCDADTNFSDTGIRYKLSGSAGSRVFVVEWRNASIGHTSGAQNNDYDNFQLALYEGSNIIEFRYGPEMVTDAYGDFTGVPGPEVWEQIQNLSLSIFRGILLYGNPADPSTVVDNTNSNNLDSVPANGTVYRFTPTVTGIDEISTALHVSIYPDPASAIATISIDNVFINGMLTVTDMMGRKMEAKKIEREDLHQSGSASIYQFETRNLANGTYFVTIADENRSVTRKLIVSH